MNVLTTKIPAEYGNVISKLKRNCGAGLVSVQADDTAQTLALSLEELAASPLWTETKDHLIGTVHYARTDAKREQALLLFAARMFLAGKLTR